MKKQTVFFIIISLLTLFAGTGRVLAQGTTALTYQGRLDIDGSGATGCFDLKFALFDSPAGGVQQGVTITNSSVGVSNGLFTATLDFGNQYNGQPRWMEIAVRGIGASNFTTLTPRQRLNPTPYANYAATVGSVGANQITGKLSTALLPTNVVLWNGSVGNLAGSFTGNGSGLTNLNSTALVGPLTVGTTLLKTAELNLEARDVTLSGNLAFVHMGNAFFGNADIQIFDISDISHPVLASVIPYVPPIFFGDDYQDASHVVAVSGNYAYVADANAGLRIYNFANPTNPVAVCTNVVFTNRFNAGVGIGDIFSVPVGVAVSGNYTYLACAFDGVRILNTQNPSNPVPIAHIDQGTVGAAPSQPYQYNFSVNVLVHGHYLYVSDVWSGVHIYDVTDPTNAVFITAVHDGGIAHSVAVAENHGATFLYVADGSDGGLKIYDVSYLEPSIELFPDWYVGGVNIHAQSGTSFQSGAEDVAVIGDNVYVANSGDGLRLFDVSNPSNPRLISSFSPNYAQHSAQGVAVSGTNIFLANTRNFMIFRNIGVAAVAPRFAGDGITLTNLSATSINSGTIGMAHLPTNLVTNGQSGVVLSGSFSGDGSGLTNLNLPKFVNDIQSGSAWKLLPASPTGDFSTISNICGAPQSLQLADFNSDGKMDIAVMGFYGRLLVLTNDGIGGFEISSAPGAGYIVSSLASADVNGDGKLDLISSSGYDGTLAVMTNDGNAGFEYETSPSVIETISVTTADFNGDGKPDLASAGFYSSLVVVVTNDGTGHFTASSTNTAGAGTYCVVAADVNGDGKPDLVTANYYDASVTVLTNNGSGGFVSAGTFSAGLGGARFVAAGDLNGDGRIDLAVAHDTTGTLTVLTNDGSGVFTATSTYSTGAGLACAAIAIGDLNQDGYPDLVSANNDANSMTVLTNNGSGGFAIAATLGTGSNPTFVAVGDLNGDGQPDIISANASDSTLTLVTTMPFVPSHFHGAFSGNGASLTNLNANSITGGLTTNIMVLVPGGGTNTLCFTNGVLRAVH